MRRGYKKIGQRGDSRKKNAYIKARFDVAGKRLPALEILFVFFCRR